MNDEKKIVIVSDENDIIAFDDITIIHDTVNRAEVQEVKRAIAKLEEDKIAIDNRLVELKAKLIYAEKIIALADEKKAEATSEVVDNSISDIGSILSNAVATDDTAN